jgi:hypothetical protein
MNHRVQQLSSFRSALRRQTGDDHGLDWKNSSREFDEPHGKIRTDQ